MARSEGTTYIDVGQSRRTMGLEGLIFQANTAGSSFGGLGIVQPTGTITNTAVVTYTLPANALNVNGRSLRITAWGTFAGTNGAAAFVRFGATDIATMSTTTNAVTWFIDAIVFRLTGTTQDAIGVISTGSAGALAASTGNMTLTTPAENLGTGIAVSIRITQNTATPATVRGVQIEVLPEGGAET